jgi:hypothetical protein
MWIWRRGSERREAPLRHRGSPRRSQPPLRKGKKPLDYYEEQEDDENYYDMDEQEQFD